MPYVNIYTYGGCPRQPGPGGYGAILVCGPRYQELSGGYHLTNNYRMELIAPIVALSALKEKCAVTVFCDSLHIIEAVSKGWPMNWQRNNWRLGNGGPVKNVDLWKRLLPLIEKYHVKFSFVKDHDGHEENERQCEQLFRDAINGHNLQMDKGYIGLRGMARM